MLARVKERVQFVSNGLELAGVLQLPDGLKKGERRAAFLVLHGFGSNKDGGNVVTRSEEHTSELQSQSNLVCRLLLEKKKTQGRVQVPQASPRVDTLTLSEGRQHGSL